MKHIIFLLGASALLVACGDKPQELTASRSDAASHTGVTTSAVFTAPGWKAGDKAGWEQQLKARQQNGQNDYSRIK